LYKSFQVSLGTLKAKVLDFWKIFHSSDISHAAQLITSMHQYQKYKNFVDVFSCTPQWMSYSFIRTSHVITYQKSSQNHYRWQISTAYEKDAIPDTKSIVSRRWRQLFIYWFQSNISQKLSIDSTKHVRLHRFWSMMHTRYSHASLMAFEHTLPCLMRWCFQPLPAHRSSCHLTYISNILKFNRNEQSNHRIVNAQKTINALCTKWIQYKCDRHRAQTVANSFIATFTLIRNTYSDRRELQSEKCWPRLCTALYVSVNRMM